MPKKIKLKPHLSTAELENRYRQARDAVERSHYQIVWLIAQGKSTSEVMEVTGYSRDWIQQLSRRYNERGPAALGDKRHENPGGAHSAIPAASANVVPMTTSMNIVRLIGITSLPFRKELASGSGLVAPPCHRRVRSSCHHPFPLREGA
jgi:hypothetical protein